MIGFSWVRLFIGIAAVCVAMAVLMAFVVLAEIAAARWGAIGYTSALVSPLLAVCVLAYAWGIPLGPVAYMPPPRPDFDAVLKAQEREKVRPE